MTEDGGSSPVPLLRASAPLPFRGEFLFSSQRRCPHVGGQKRASEAICEDRRERPRIWCYHTATALGRLRATLPTPRAPRGSSPAMMPSDARTWPVDLGCSPERLVSVPMRGGEGCFAREDDKVLIIQPLWLIPWCHRAFSSTGKKHLRFHLYQPHMPCGLGRLEPGGAPRQQVSLRTGVCLWLHGNLNPPAASCEASYLGVGEGHLSLVLVFPLFWGGRPHLPSSPGCSSWAFAVHKEAPPTRGQ